MLTHTSTKFCPGQNKHSIRLQLLQNLGPDLNYFINTDCINFYYSEVSGFDSLLSIFLKKHLFSHWNQDNCIQIFITQNKTLHFLFLFFWLPWSLSHGPLHLPAIESTVVGQKDLLELHH